MRKPSFLLCVKCPRYEWKVIRENRGTHGVSSLMLSTLVLSNEKPPPLCVSIGGGSMSQKKYAMNGNAVSASSDLESGSEGGSVGVEEC